jgi:hypothetical protein
MDWILHGGFYFGLKPLKNSSIVSDVGAVARPSFNPSPRHLEKAF